MRAVLDTNVLVSAAIRKDGNPDQIVRLAGRKFELLTSKYILTEVTQVLARKHIQAKYLSYLMAQDRRLLEQNLRAIAKTVMVKAKTTTRLRGAVPDDPEDEPVLACAVEGEANYLVTGDPHLLALQTFGGIKIVTPAQFLEVLEHSSR